LSSGAFSHTPQAQKFVANKVHVDAGLAKKVGQIASMPPGVFVQDDGSVLIDTGRVGDPCNPSPCPLMGTPRCVAVSSSTAKCIGPDSKSLVLRWSDPVDEDAVTSSAIAPDAAYDIRLVIVPSKNYDSTACSVSTLVPGQNACGASISAHDSAIVSSGKRGTGTAVLETSASDDATFKDYTYAVYAERLTVTPDATQILDTRYNLAVAGVKLVFYSDLNGAKLPEFVYTVPQGSSINTGNKKRFFFGCIRPNVIHMKAIDTRGAGFYGPADSIRGTGKLIDDPTLCDSLKNAVPAIVPGFQQ